MTIICLILHVWNIGITQSHMLLAYYHSLNFSIVMCKPNNSCPICIDKLLNVC